MIADDQTPSCKDAVSRDEHLQEEAQASIAHRLGMMHSRIDVKVDRGTATLHGRLARYYHKQLAQESLKAVPGINRVNNEIVVVTR